MLSDFEFICHWHHLQSPQLMSDMLQMELRNVYDRRKSIENKYGVLLETKDARVPRIPTATKPDQIGRAHV